MSKNILSLFGFLCLIVIAFLAGYFVRSRNCRFEIPPQVANLVPSVTQPTTTVTTIPSPTETVTPKTELVFSNYNSAAVGNQPTAPTVFTLKKSATIYLIQDYHWNSARGKTPGTIALKGADGTVYGPWQARGDPGQGGVPDAYWTVYPNVEIPAGTYTVIDSDPASWAQNSGTRGIGMSQVYAVKE